MKTLLQTILALMRNPKGFVLPLTLVTCVIILTIATGISVILAKELYFSKLSRLSQVAYYAADSGIMCATMIDDLYTDYETGSGIFQYNNLVTSSMVLDKVNDERAERGLTAINLNDIKCATSEIFNSAVTGFAVTPFSRVDSSGMVEEGKTSTFNMRMDLGGGLYRCATVLVNKTPTYRQIISRGFASCGLTLSYPVERAIVSTSESVNIEESDGGSGVVSGTNLVRTSGSSWVVPEGISTIKVWAIGAGGGGAGSANSDASSGGGGGAGGIAYKTYSVTPGQVISYSLGVGGVGGSGATEGANGQDTTITVDGVTIRGRGGEGGRFNTGVNANGGNATGGAQTRKGGDGAGASGDTGGGGGGGLVLQSGDSTGNCAGGNGGVAGDLQGYLAIVDDAGYQIGSGYAGVGGDCRGGVGANTAHGGNAQGFGNGGGGAGYNGGDGGNGAYGGGGGGAAGYTSGTHTGGTGGNGVVIISGS